MFVEDYMTANPLTVGPEDSLVHAQSLMDRHRIRHLPVLEGHRLVGIISDRDVRTAAGFDRLLAEKLTVVEVMTPDPVTISLSASLNDAVAILLSNRFGALPALNRERLVGIITYVDVLRAFVEVLGLNQPGHCVEVALPEGFADAARAFHALRACDGEMISAVVSRTRRDGGEPALYLRVTPDSVGSVERRLREATLILLTPERR